jgi:hypothetical protein
MAKEASEELWQQSVEDRFGGSSTLSETTALSNRARQNPKTTTGIMWCGKPDLPSLLQHTNQPNDVKRSRIPPYYCSIFHKLCIWLEQLT